jgi:glycosyltransferase involved in cell wall biosynthesis
MPAKGKRPMLENVITITPAYNAARTIRSVFDRIPDVARGRISRFVVVNDGSTDDTGAVLAELKVTMPNLDVLEHPENRGYGAAEKTLLRHACDLSADAAILLHADGQYSPEMIPEMLRPLDDGQADLVQGSRMLGGGALKGGMPFYKYVSNKWLTAIENRAFGLRMAEYHSGYMLYSRGLLEGIPFDQLSDSFDFDLEMIVCAHILGMSIHETAIPTIYADEASHLNPIKYGLNVLSIVRRYRSGYYHTLLGLDGAERGKS